MSKCISSHTVRREFYREVAGGAGVHRAASGRMSTIAVQSRAQAVRAVGRCVGPRSQAD